MSLMTLCSRANLQKNQRMRIGKKDLVKAMDQIGLKIMLE